MAGGRHAHAAHGAPALRPRRRVAWLVWTIVLAVVLGAYAIALRWVTLEVESGVEASINNPLATDAPLKTPAP